MSAGCKYTCHTACRDRVSLDCHPVASPVSQDQLNNNNTHYHVSMLCSVRPRGAASLLDRPHFSAFCRQMLHLVGYYKKGWRICSEKNCRAHKLASFKLYFSSIHIWENSDVSQKDCCSTDLGHMRALWAKIWSDRKVQRKQSGGKTATEPECLDQKQRDKYCSVNRWSWIYFSVSSSLNNKDQSLYFCSDSHLSIGLIWTEQTHSTRQPQLFWTINEPKH